jgi:hypothetical protein
MAAPTCVLPVGIPASGKSSFYKARLADTHVRVNQDMLGTPHRVRLLRDGCLSGGISFVLDSVLASEAGGKFSLLLGDVAAFDCRISELPTEQLVVDYFRWRHEDAMRNALHGHCYWLLRGQGLTDRQATVRLEGRSIAERNELLFQHGINFNALPAWQKRGVGLWWVQAERPGVNPRTGEATSARRWRLHREEELPLGDAYATLVRERIAEASSPDGEG